MRTTEKSTALFHLAEKYVPGASGTGSKRAKHLPDEPGIIVRGEGCRVWDADGNAYIDFRNGLGPVTLGYRFPEVDAAIRAQLDRGTVFGHPCPLEAEVAQALTELVPAAEKVRFLKTGGEACAAAIRVARAFTGRELIVQIGYNGWLNAVAAGGPVLPGRQAAAEIPPGVPRAVSELFRAANWDDPENVETIFRERGESVAAVIVACDYPHMERAAAFLPFLREITLKYGALLILDEIVTGFRLAIGGAHERFGVKPDLAVFAKGMANGMPLSAFVGSARVMATLDGDCVVSSTYSGEALSLAAAKATIAVYRERNVVGRLWEAGRRMWDGFNRLAAERGAPVRAVGFPVCPKLVFEDTAYPERFYRAAYRNGVSLYQVSYVNYSHGDKDIDEALERLRQAMNE